MTEDKPTPAEAATEVGQEEPDFYGTEMALEELASIVLWGFGIFALVVFVGFLVGYFA